MWWSRLTYLILDIFAEVGIDLGTATFQAYFDNTLVGREFLSSGVIYDLRRGSLALMATDLVLLPEGEVTSHLSGRIVPQSGDALNVIGRLFSEYLAADNITLNVTGESVQPTGASSPVTWLSDAFRTFTLEVTLPGQAFQVGAVVRKTYRLLTFHTDYSIHCTDGPKPDDGNAARSLCPVVGFK